MGPFADAQSLLLVAVSLLPYALTVLAGSARVLRTMVLAMALGLGYLWWSVLSVLGTASGGPHVMLLALLTLGALSGAGVRGLTLYRGAGARLLPRPWPEIAGAATLTVLVTGLAARV